MTDCIDLLERFGDRYQVTHEESYRAERGDGAYFHEPTLLIIPCRHGHIYPHGGDLLGASTNYRGPIANSLANLPSVRVVQDGDDGINCVFPASDFARVAKIMKPKRRRKLTPERRNKLVADGQNYQISSGVHVAGSDRRRDPVAPVAKVSHHASGSVLGPRHRRERARSSNGIS